MCCELCLYHISMLIFFSSLVDGRCSVLEQHRFNERHVISPGPNCLFSGWVQLLLFELQKLQGCKRDRLLKSWTKSFEVLQMGKNSWWEQLCIEQGIIYRELACHCRLGCTCFNTQRWKMWAMNTVTHGVLLYWTVYGTVWFVLNFYKSIKSDSDLQETLLLLSTIILTENMYKHICSCK